MSDVVVRPHTPDDDDAAGWVWLRASSTMRRDHGLPWQEPNEATLPGLRARFAHVRSTDPAGCFVAEVDGSVVGLAHALMRERLWVCSLFGVDPSWQSRGIGRSLLDAVLAYGDPSLGLIAASADARAVHRYETVGFARRPALSAVGAIDTTRLEATPDVRDGSIDDLAWTGEVDRFVRGATREPDVRFALEAGATLLVVPRVGYAVVQTRPVLLAATDEAGARQLLSAALTRSDGPDVEVGWITEQQRWVFDVLTPLSFEYRAGGSIMVRGEPGPLEPWLPHGGFC